MSQTLENRPLTLAEVSSERAAHRNLSVRWFREPWQFYRTVDSTGAVVFALVAWRKTEWMLAHEREDWRKRV